MPSGVEVQAAQSADVKPPITSGEDTVEKKDAVITDAQDAGEKQEAAGDEEGIEVVLEGRGATKVMESPEKPRPTPNQSIFRHPDAVRPRAMRAPGGPPPHHPHPPPPYHPHHHPHYLHGSGSWGYGPPPPHEYPPHAVRPPYPVPPYNSSGSFDDQGSYHHHTPHYSPHVHYPPPRYASDVNVISPNHKGDPHYRPPLTPRPRHLPPPPQPYYHYPPTSPVSRPSSGPAGPPRIRDYAMRRSEGAYARAQRADQYHPEDGTWNSYPPSTAKSPKPESSRAPPPVVADSFDSEHHSARSSHPPTPGSNAPPPPAPLAPPSSSHDPHHQFYGGGGSWGSFDSAAPPPPHYDERYYGFPPDSPYSPYGAPYSPGGLYQSESFPPPPGYGYPPPPPSFSYSHDEDERLLKDYNPDRDGEHAHKHARPSKSKGRGKSGTPVSSNTSNRNMVLPKAAEEIDFDVTEPPMEPILPPGDIPLCESLADVNTYDVLCGRGGGTNSQVGNRRFRKLVQDFQPTYLMAKRKEKPLIARTIVLIIRKRGGRFLKKNEETGELFEVGDAKAEAKTSQALREGLDVRATKSAATSLVDKKKKKKTPGSPRTEDDDDDDDEEEELEEVSSPKSNKSEPKETKMRAPESPPTLPRLQGEEAKAGTIHPHSPEQSQFRKRRRMRSTERYIPDFCPPRADLGRGSPSPDDEDEGVLDVETTPIRRNSTRDDDYEGETQTQGCAGIALDIVTGAASGSFCLGPSGWRR